MPKERKIKLARFEGKDFKTAFIREVLAQDPRPAYRKEEEAGKNYAVWLLDFNADADPAPAPLG
jgi:hypothetical protein